MRPGQPIRGFRLFVLSYVTVFFLAQSPKIFDYYRVSDDIRQQLYPLHLARDGELFPNDLLTKYFRSHTPPLFYYSHYPLAWLVGPIILSKISQFALLALLLVVLHRIGRQLHGPLLGWALILLAVHSGDLVGMTDGGLPRAWAAPGTVVFIWAVLVRRPSIALLAVTISGVFYPPILLVLGPCYAVWILVERKFTWWNIPAALLLTVGVYPMVFRDPEIGRILDYAQAAAMPEWQAGNRFPFTPIPSWWHLAPRYFTASLVPAQRFSAWCWIGVATGLSALLAARLRKAQSPGHTTLIWAAGLPLFFSLVMYEVSAAVAFRLHIPDRNLKYTIPVLGLILIATAVFRAAHLRSDSPSETRSLGAAVGLAVVAFFLGGSGFQSNLNLWANQRFASPLYQFVATLPKDTLLAGPPKEMDNLPLFSRRMVFVSDEAAQPLYDRYYAEVSRRLKVCFAAYYATESETIRHFVRQTGVRYMVVRIEDFTDRFGQIGYHEPYRSYIRNLIGDKDRSSFLLARPAPESVMYDDRFFRVVDLTVLASRDSD